MSEMIRIKYDPSPPAAQGPKDRAPLSIWVWSALSAAAVLGVLWLTVWH